MQFYVEVNTRKGWEVMGPDTFDNQLDALAFFLSLGIERGTRLTCKPDGTELLLMDIEHDLTPFAAHKVQCMGCAEGKHPHAIDCPHRDDNWRDTCHART